MVLLFLFGCTKAEDISKIENSPTSDSDKTIADNDVNTTVNQTIVYSNAKLGFILEFPKTWDGHYSIEDIGDKMIRVNFIGNSKAGQGFVGDTQESNGLLMFYIGKEGAFNDLEVDSKKEIGTINGIDICFAVGTDYPIGSLDLSTDQSMSDLVTDKSERELMKNDFLKAKEMEADIENVLRTFKSLE